MKSIRITSTATALLLFGTMMPVYAQHEEGAKQEEKRPQQQAPHPPQPQQRVQAAPQQQQRPQQAAPREKAQQAQKSAPEQRSQPQQAQQTHAVPPARQQPEQHARQAMQPRAQQLQQKSQPAQQARTGPQAQPQRTQQQARSWQQQKGWQQGGASPGHATFAQDRSQNWSSDHRTWAQRGGYGGYYIPQDRFGASFGSQHFFRLGVLPAMYLGYPRFSYGGFSFLMVDPFPGDWATNWYDSDDMYIGFNNGYYLYDRRYPQEAVAITIQL